MHIYVCIYTYIYGRTIYRSIKCCGCCFAPTSELRLPLPSPKWLRQRWLGASVSKPGVNLELPEPWLSNRLVGSSAGLSRGPLPSHGSGDRLIRGA